ncbi:NAD(P)/FAD-dependent oxidoreductase [Schumannella soli]|nr:FAD-dependent oxidoreductase [Schumannella soli]
MPGTTVFERYPPSDAVLDAALADTRLAPLWLDVMPARRPRPELVGDATADLCVVGGGLTGLWTAVLAAQREPGRRILLVEGKRLGWAASGRSGGIVDSRIAGAHAAQRWPDDAAELQRLGRANLDAMELDVGALRLDVDWHRSGELLVAAEPHQLAQLRGGHRSPDGSLPDTVLLDTEEVRAEIDSPGALGGTWRRRDAATLDPARLVVELARVAQDLGVEIVENSPVRALIDRPDGVDVVTAGGRVRADSVALATSAFPSLLRRTRLLTLPVYEYALATEPLSPRRMKTLGWQQRQALRGLGRRAHWMRRSGDDRVVFGGYFSQYHYGGRLRAAHEDRPDLHRELAAHLLTTFPQLEGVRFSHRWAGAVDRDTRGSGHYGTAREGRIAYAGGFSGTGLGTARFAGEVMLDLMSGQRTERTALGVVREKPAPFPPEPAVFAAMTTAQRALNRADHRGGAHGPLLRALRAVGLAP